MVCTQSETTTDEGIVRSCMIIVIVVGMMPGMHPEIHHHYEVYISMYLPT